MRVISMVAVNVFKESVRDKVLYNLVFFAILLMATSYLLGQLTAGQDIKIIKDLGLAAISIFGLLIAVFIGIGLVWKEVDRRSIYSLLTKPMRRSEFLLGKYAGLALTLGVNVVVMTLAFYVVLAALGFLADQGTIAALPAPATDPMMLAALLLIFVELLLVTAVALFFSTFSSPFLSAVLTLGLWVIGHFNADLRNFEAVVDSRPAVLLARGLYYVLPNFSAFDIKAQVVHGLPVASSYLALTAAYGGVYIALLLAGAVLIFERRDFKQMRARSWRAVVLVLVPLAGVVGLQAVRERREPLAVTGADGVLYLRSAAVVERAVLSYDALAADVYWLRVVQYYGTTKLAKDPTRTYELLYPLLDLTTSLDPRFNIAYRFGSLFLAEPPPGGPGRPDLAIALLEKGLREQPTKWEFAQDVGFVHYWWLHDYEKAADWFARAAKMPGAPAWLAPVAAVTLAQGGSRQSSRRLWQEILQSADQEWLRSSAEQRLRQLTAMDQLDQLRGIVGRYQERHGQPPQRWRDVIAARMIRGVPVDPDGFAYQLMPGTPFVILHPKSTLNPLPIEPLQLP